MNEKILVVDDEKEIADLLEVYLKNDNYIVHKYYNGIEALECIQKTEIDLAILDVMLPDIDGFRICQKIRENYYFPVIMLTAKIDDGDKIMGLTIGADDYITKPFNPLEVIARVKTQLRRYQKYNNPTKKQFFPKSEYDIRGLIINKDTHKCFLFGKEISLTPIEFSILWYLCEHQGKVVSTEELFENIWKEKYLDNNNTVMAHIGRLREKLNEPAKNPKFIKTVWGVGMKLNKNEQNYLLTILFKSYILQSVICSGIILVCTVSLDMGLTWVLDRYVEHYYLIYRGLYVYMVGLILWVVCILYLTYKLLKKVVNYVYELQAATGKLFDKSVDYIELSPELSEIAININRLKQEAENNARLAQENEQRKNDLIMYLAHDLKTPLSSVIGYLTLLHDDEQQISQELREKYLSISLDKAERLEDLINEFFEITRFNLSNITLQYSNINLTRLLEQLIYEFKPILKEKNLKCTLNSTSDIMLHCDANKIQRVFDNLLRNAVIYSYTDTEVAITTELQENTIVITFENFGNPIAEEKLKLIFEQFYRVDTSRNTTSGGAGLGLAIAKHIVELHKGTIVAHSKDECIKFIVTLPLS